MYSKCWERLAWSPRQSPLVAAKQHESILPQIHRSISKKATVEKDRILGVESSRFNGSKFESDGIHPGCILVSCILMMIIRMMNFRWSFHAFQSGERLLKWKKRKFECQHTIVWYYPLRLLGVEDQIDPQQPRSSPQGELTSAIPTL